MKTVIFKIQSSVRFNICIYIAKYYLPVLKERYFFEHSK
nr:MAG TPA: hypothetical protein [Caudoviricetes sp.]